MSVGAHEELSFSLGDQDVPPNGGRGSSRDGLESGLILVHVVALVFPDLSETL